MPKFIVVYDDEQGLCVPYGADSDCDGALCCSEPVMLFDCRDDAKVAIRISTKYAELRKAQGEYFSDDFLLPCRKNVRIVPVESYTPEPKD